MILAFEAFLAGSVVYAGVKTFKNRRRKKSALWLNVGPSDSQAMGQSFAPAPDEVNIAGLEKRIGRNFGVSSISLGLSVSGALVYPPLGLASVPLTIYGAIPTFENAAELLFNEGRAKLSVVNSIVIIGALAANYYFVASLFQWGYHLNQKLLVELNQSYRQILSHAFGPQSRSVWIVVNDIEVKVPRQEVNVGDIVVVNEGEMIPVDGVITDGTALIDMYILSGQARPVESKPGDKALTATTVLSGKIFIRVKKV